MGVPRQASPEQAWVYVSIHSHTHILITPQIHIKDGQKVICLLSVQFYIHSILILQVQQSNQFSFYFHPFKCFKDTNAILHEYISIHQSILNLKISNKKD